MEEEKAAAYYDELTRKGEGAARFKQGLGFSSSSSSSHRPSSDSFPSKSSSPFTAFVRASSPGTAAEIQKKTQLDTIHNKLKKKPSSSSDHRSNGSDRSRERDDRHSSRPRPRSSSRERERRRETERSSSRHGHGSRGREEERGERERSGKGRRHRSRSASEEEEEDRGGRRRSRRSRSRSPSSSRHSHGRDRDEGHMRRKGSPRRDKSKNTSADVDYSRLIDGYSEMTPAERVKAKMKLQLSQTAAKDTAKGTNTGWERFDFNKDAPLDDDDDEIEVADDDASVVKDIGRSFRFSAVEAKREEEIKAAHDQAMFGASAASPILPEKGLDNGSNEEVDMEECNKKQLSTNLISDKVLSAQQGSWRDRARKFQHESKN